MNYSLFDKFPSAIVVLSNDSIIYKNDSFNIIVNNVNNVSNLPKGIRDFYKNDSDPFVYLNDTVYYARKIVILSPVLDELFTGDEDARSILIRPGTGRSKRRSSSSAGRSILPLDQNSSMECSEGESFRSIQDNIYLEFQDIHSTNINVLINNLSKEIRSPLHGIAGIVDILTNAGLNTQQEEYIGIIRECSTDLLHIINNISDYVKLTEKRLKLKENIFDMNEIIDETYNMLQSKIKEKDILLHYNIEPFFQKYIGDFHRIQQILIHILTNSIEYTNKGNIELNIKKLISEHEFDVITFEIKDTGIGIKQEDISKLFQPFCKTKDTLSNHIGLGLVITKCISEMMNGGVDIDSKYNKGTTITITLKVKRNETISDFVFQNKLKNKNVLVINNDNQERYDLSSFIIKNKMRITATPSIKEAVTVYLENNYIFDFIIINSKNKDEIKKFRDKITSENCTIIEIGDTEGYLTIPRPIQFDKLKLMLYDYSKSIISKLEKTILIVEDQISNQIVISKYLNNMGHKNIDIANNGEESIIKVLNRNEKYDLILMDIMMPVMDGIDATKSIMKIDSSNIILGVTADSIRDVNECIKIGMKDIIIKPVSFKDFKNTCEKYL